MSEYLLEAPVFNLKAAIEAAEYGVDRIELCASFPEGGETPSPGILSFLKKEIDIPIFVMIRPRGGDFCYSEKEISIMKEDVKLYRDLGAGGLVFGCLNADGEVNEAACEVLLRTAGGTPCTFHRAFDASRDLVDSLEKVINLGFARILTSGGSNTVSEGFDIIQDLMEQAEDRITIMPGGGSRPEHVQRLKGIPHFSEIHASCKAWKLSDNRFEKEDLIFSDESRAFTHYLGLEKELVDLFQNELKS